MRLHLLLAAAPLALMAACAAAPPAAGAGPSSAGGVVANVSPYGMFLAGESALNNGKSQEAAKFFDQARLETGDPLIAERAFTSALLAGDIQKASALAPTAEDATE